MEISRINAGEGDMIAKHNTSSYTESWTWGGKVP